MGSELATVADIAATSAPWSEDLVHLWLYNLDNKPKTRTTYAQHIAQFAKYLREAAVPYPTRRAVMGFRDHLTAVGRKATTVNAYLIAVKQMFKYLARVGKYPDVANGVKTLNVGKDHKRDNLTAAQASALMRECDDAKTIQRLRDRAMLALDITAGLRTIELSRANVGDLRTVGSQQWLAVQGKGHDDKDRLVKVTPEAERAIAAYLHRRGNATDDAPLFCSHSPKNTGHRMHSVSISAIIKAHLRDAGMDSPRLTAHSLRHTAATFAIEGGATIAQVQQVLGHTSINTTMIYNHAIERERNDAELRAGRQIDYGMEFAQGN